MCSILGIFEIKSDSRQLRELALEMSRKQRHRGPDWSGIWSSDSAVLAHERLAIVDVENGAQPLFSPQPGSDIAPRFSSTSASEAALARLSRMMPPAKRDVESLLWGNDGGESDSLEAGRVLP